MKKISLYMIALLSAVFTGCSDNYDPEVGPQSNQQESPVKVSDVSVTNSVGAIDLTHRLPLERLRPKKVLCLPTPC